LLRTLEQLRHLAGTDRNQLQAQNTRDRLPL